MSGFAALMALSASQTKETQSAVQSALAQRQRKEELRRKQQEERERKERELENKLRLKHFEEEKKEQERQARLEQERQARERALQRREEEQRDALRYGPKKAKAVSSSDGAPKWPTSSSRSQEEGRRRKTLSDEDDDLGSPGTSLTREEKRERKLQAELKRTFHTARRSVHSGGYVKEGRRLPGGAIDVTTTSPGQADSASATQSIKARISAIPNTLTKLNIVKRDVRTIDEIRQDLAKVKVLAGDEAREFNDWFGKAKKKEPAKSIVQPFASAPSSGANTPASQTSKGSASAPGVAASVVAVKKSNGGTSSPSGAKLATTSVGTKTVLKSAHRDSHTPPAAKSGASPSTPLMSTMKASISRSSSFPSKKRMRTPSLSDFSVLPKKRALSPDPARDNLSNEIWKLFGKDRGSYVRKDVLSDDEDMEVGASVLEREELRSTRIAKKEEEEALEAERQHEHEKRKRKKEKEMRDKRG